MIIIIIIIDSVCMVFMRVMVEGGEQQVNARWRWDETVINSDRTESKREKRDEREELYSSESISPTREKVTDEFSFADRERAEEIWLLSTYDDCRMPAWPLQRRGRVHVEKWIFNLIIVVVFLSRAYLSSSSNRTGKGNPPALMMMMMNKSWSRREVEDYSTGHHLSACKQRFNETIRYVSDAR